MGVVGTGKAVDAFSEFTIDDLSMLYCDYQPNDPVTLCKH